MGKSKGTRKVLFCIVGDNIVMHTKIHSAGGRKRYGDKISVALTTDETQGLAVGKGAYVDQSGLELRVAEAIKASTGVV